MSDFVNIVQFLPSAYHEAICCAGYVRNSGYGSQQFCFLFGKRRIDIGEYIVASANPILFCEYAIDCGWRETLTTLPPLLLRAKRARIELGMLVRHAQLASRRGYPVHLRAHTHNGHTHIQRVSRVI